MRPQNPHTVLFPAAALRYHNANLDVVFEVLIQVVRVSENHEARLIDGSRAKTMKENRKYDRGIEVEDEDDADNSSTDNDDAYGRGGFDAELI